MKIYQVAIGEIRLPVEMGGGADNFLFQVSRHLARRGHEVTLLERRHTLSDQPVEHLDGLEMVRLKAPRLSLGLLARVPALSSLCFFLMSAVNQSLFARRVRRYLSRQPQADVVHFHSSPIGLGLLLGRRKLARCLVYTSHTPRRLLDSPGPLDRLALALENWLVRRVDKVTVLNQAVRERLFQATRVNGDIAVLPVGIDPTQFHPEVDPGDVAHRYSYDGKTPLLFVGRINPVKGVEHLVAALDILVNRWGYAELVLLLVGPVEGFTAQRTQRTPYLEGLLSLIRERRLEGVVRLTGPVGAEDLRRLYATCHVFVLPSLSEAMPTAVLEAMACARPVVASRVGGIPEQVEEGRSGFLVPPRDAEALADRIKYLMDNPQEARAMGAHGRRLVEERFTWEHIARRMEEIYNGVVGA